MEAEEYYADYCGHLFHRLCIIKHLYETNEKYVKCPANEICQSYLSLKFIREVQLTKFDFVGRKAPAKCPN